MRTTIGPIIETAQVEDGAAAPCVFWARCVIRSPFRELLLPLEHASACDEAGGQSPEATRELSKMTDVDLSCLYEGRYDIRVDLPYSLTTGSNEDLLKPAFTAPVTTSKMASDLSPISYRNS